MSDHHARMFNEKKSSKNQPMETSEKFRKVQATERPIEAHPGVQHGLIKILKTMGHELGWILKNRVARIKCTAEDETLALIHPTGRVPVRHNTPPYVTSCHNADDQEAWNGTIEQMERNTTHSPGQ